MAIDQALLDKIEQVLEDSLTNEGAQITVDHENGGSVTYRGYDELFDLYQKVYKFLNRNTDLNLDEAQGSAYAPVSTYSSDTGRRMR